MRIAIVIFDGFDELDAIGPWEVLRTAERQGADLRATVVALGGAREVVASHGLRARADGGLADGPWDWVIVPGGNWTRPDVPGARAEAEGPLPAALAEVAASGARMSSVCTGAMLLARAGLLSGRRATTHAVAKADLRAAGARVEDARVVDDGDRVTAAGVTSGIDLALHLVHRLAGPAAAQGVSKTLEYPWIALAEP